MAFSHRSILSFSQGAKIFSQRPDFQEKFSIDRISWETMKKKGADQQSIWGNCIYNKQQ
jgi:hypothetical protein